jgi:hypothetical protein
MTVPFSEHLSEQWLIKRTYHAYLNNGEELAVPTLTTTMKQLIDVSVPLSLQSWKSRLPEMVPPDKSYNFSVPIPAWKEISQEEAFVLSQQAIPILLYGKHAWEHQKGSSGTWRPNRNMQRIIYGDVHTQPETVSGTEDAVGYLDPKRGMFSNAAWRAWFSSNAATLLDGNTPSTATFFAPYVQFPYSTHYTVVAPDGHIHECADRAEAIQQFDAFPLQEEDNGSAGQTVVAAQFCYYHDVICSSGTYRLEFFGPRMEEQGYQVKQFAETVGGRAHERSM